MKTGRRCRSSPKRNVCGRTHVHAHAAALIHALHARRLAFNAPGANDECRFRPHDCVDACMYVWVEEGGRVHPPNGPDGHAAARRREVMNAARARISLSGRGG